MDKYKEAIIPYSVISIFVLWAIVSGLGKAEAMEVVKNFVVAIVALLGTYQAMLSLETWRAELRGRDAYKLAKEIGLLAQKISVKMRQSRYEYYPIIGNDFRQRVREFARFVGIKDEDELPEHMRPYLVFLANYQSVSEEIYKLSGMLDEARLYGIEIERFVEEIRSIYSELYLEAGKPVFLKPEQLGEEGLNQVRKKLFGGGGGKSASDEIERRIIGAEEEILGILGDYI